MLKTESDVICYKGPFVAAFALLKNFFFLFPRVFGVNSRELNKTSYLLPQGKECCKGGRKNLNQQGFLGLPMQSVSNPAWASFIKPQKGLGWERASCGRWLSSSLLAQQVLTLYQIELLEKHTHTLNSQIYYRVQKLQHSFCIPCLEPHPLPSKFTNHGRRQGYTGLL